MFDTRKTLHAGGMLDIIKILATNQETGRLEMKAGTTEGAFYFRNGQLVDARVGHLAGFQAVNAVASMRNARFHFDPTVTPPQLSSITPNERVVLRQFFGVETAGAEDLHEGEEYLPDDEVTLEMQGIPRTVEPEEIPVEAPPVPVPDGPSSRSLYRGGLILACLFLLITVAAVTLRNKYRARQQALPEATAMTEQVSPKPAAQELKPVAQEVKVETTQPRAVTPQVRESVPSTDEPLAARNLSGKWNIVNTVQKTAYRSFQDMKIGFDLSINQSGKTFTGTGQKVSENGHSLPANSRTPIQLKGSIDGDRVEATFFEEGSLRKTNGRFVWRVDKSGGLSGTFVSTAAATSGKSAARKS
jgi:hypothetical protein